MFAIKDLSPQMESAKITKQLRIPELDGLRGCAILLVLVYHYVHQQIHAAPKSVGSYVAACISLTFSGVDLFFVLSGFLIAGILMDNRSAGNFLRVFYARRVCRIFPLYFLLLALFMLLIALGMGESTRFAWLFENPFPMWSYATFTQNILMAFRGDTGPRWLAITWSLAVEEQFYLVIPLLIWLLPRRVFAVVALLLVFLAPLLRAVVGGLPGYVLTPWRADSLLSGALLAIAVRDEVVLRLLRSNIGFLYATFLGFLGGAAVMTFRPDVFGVASHTWLAGLYGVLLLLAIIDPATLVARVLRNRVLVWCGVMSYGLYMYHQAVSGLVHGFLGDGIPTVQTVYGAALTAVALALTLLVSAVSFHLFERPFLALGQRFKYEAPGEPLIAQPALSANNS